MPAENSEKLHDYIKTISNDTSLLEPFLALMNKQHGEKPVTLFDGLSVYRQKNTNNYSYRIYNSLWGVDDRKSCKTPDKEEAKVIALKAWGRYETMKEFDLINKKGETFIQFAERIVIPELVAIKDGFDKEYIAGLSPQIKKQAKQKYNGINKRINHLRNNCKFLHDKLITELRLKDFSDFALHTLDHSEALSYDTFSNYMTRIRNVLDIAVSEGVILTKPDTTINKQIKDKFLKKQKRHDLSDVEINIIFGELEEAISTNKDNLSPSKTSQYSEGRLVKLQNYLYYLKFILATGIRPGDECFQIQWSDFKIKDVGAKANPCLDYYCMIKGGKIESGKAEGREILISKGSEGSKVFIDCLSPLAKLQGFSGIKSAIESKSNDYIFVARLENLKRDLKKWKIFSMPFEAYQFRHTYITKRILQSESLGLISKQCGNSVAQIEATYNHATNEMYRKVEEANKHK
jgi:integrase